MRTWQRFKNGAPVTTTLVIINVLVFVWMLLRFHLQTVSLFSTFSGQNLLDAGALYGPAVRTGDWWRLITPMFIHLNLEHIGLNMITLYFLGREVEATFGHWRTLIIYLISGVAGNIWSTFFQPQGLSAGASTAIFGLFGAFIALDAIDRGNPVIHQLARQFALLVVVNLVFDIFAVGIDIWGHIGGLLGGVAIALLVGVPHLNRRYSFWLRLVGLAGVLVVGSLMLTIY